jgi:hypothetical protein
LWLFETLLARTMQFKLPLEESIDHNVLSLYFTPSLK